MFARVIPALRTPFGVDAFDYAIPDGMDVAVGDLVWIPFRRRLIVGVVAELATSSPFAGKVKALQGRYADLRLPPLFVELVREAAKRTFSSQATVVHAWLRTLPRRPVSIRTSDEPVPRRTLIIVPWKERVLAYAQARHAPYLTSDTAPAFAFKTWSTFLASEDGVLVTTRVGAWLACAAQTIIVDEPENDDHKQDELAPRYDARWIAEFCAKKSGATLESVTRTPRIGDAGEARTIEVDLVVRERQKAGRSDVPTLLADTLADLVTYHVSQNTHHASRIVYHPIRGVAARLRCRDCSWSAACGRCTFPLSIGPADAECRRCGAHEPLPETCPHCGSVSLGASTPGIERLQAVWQSKYADTPVEWRTLSNADVEKPFPNGALVVVTDGALLAGVIEDVRRLECTAIAFRRLADRVGQAGGRLIIQSDASLLASWERWLTSEGFAVFREEELASRKLFGYPPTKRLVKILVDGMEEEALAWGERAKACFDANWELRGPWPVAYRSKGRSTRFVWHAVTGPDTPDADLINLFTPLAAQGILIDLDPTAFFR